MGSKLLRTNWEVITNRVSIYVHTALASFGNSAQRELAKDVLVNRLAATKFLKVKTNKLAIADGAVKTKESKTTNGSVGTNGATTDGAPPTISDAFPEIGNSYTLLNTTGVALKVELSSDGNAAKPRQVHLSPEYQKVDIWSVDELKQLRMMLSDATYLEVKAGDPCDVVVKGQGGAQQYFRKRGVLLRVAEENRKLFPNLRKGHELIPQGDMTMRQEVSLMNIRKGLRVFRNPISWSHGEEDADHFHRTGGIPAPSGTIIVGKGADLKPGRPWFGDSRLGREQC